MQVNFLVFRNKFGMLFQDKMNRGEKHEDVALLFLACIIY